MLTSLRQLLTAIVDYAGLFPPAQLGISEAIAHYDRGRASAHAWMLDRFVIPAARLSELSILPDTVLEHINSTQPWTLSVTLSGNWAAELKHIDRFYQAEFQDDYPIKIVALEVAPLTPDEIQRCCQNLPVDLERFFEIPWSTDLEPYLPVLQQTGSAAKLRTGGITADAFPDLTQLSQRIMALADAQLPFKATAGLHHVLRGNYRLTYAPDSPSAPMLGFLTLALLSAFTYHQRMTIAETLALLEEHTIAPFQLTDTAITWRDRSLSLAEIDQARRHFFRSFGSCSFQEPIDDLYHLRLL